MIPDVAIGAFVLKTHLLTNLAAGLVVGAWARRRSLSRFPVFGLHEKIDLVFYLFCGVLGGALVGATLPYVLMSLGGTPMPPWWWMGWQNWFGAVTGGALSGLLYCYRNQRPVGWSFDLFAPLLPVGLAIVRVGCLLAGDSQGKLTTAWPAMVLPDPNGVWASRYPTQPVDIAINVLLAGVLFGFEKARGALWHKPASWPFEGFVFWLYVLLFCSQRFYFEFWRADTPVLWYPFSWNHLYCVMGLGLAVWGMWRGLRGRVHS